MICNRMGLEGSAAQLFDDPRVLFQPNATGEITMGSGRAGKGMGHQASKGPGTTGTANQDMPDDSQFLGPDQIRARNERRGVPGETTRTQGVVESFELMDPKKRAEHMKRQGR
jgi:hypothetical protein